MSGHNNAFSTEQLRTRQEAALSNSMSIITSSPAVEYPIGLTRIASERTRDITITSYFDNVKFIESNKAFSATIHLDGWGDSTLQQAACTWLPVCSPDRDFQHGRVVINRDCLIHGVTFNQEYASTPNVVVWLSGFHLGEGTSWQFRVDATQVTTKGLILKAEVWGTTVLHRMEVTWIAYPPSRSNIESGGFTNTWIPVGAVSRCPPHDYSTIITFKKNFDRAPRVYFALNRIDMTNEGDMRIVSDVQDVTCEEMTLNIHSWSDTRMYSGEGQWIAIQDF